jgi:hypothetical protein
LPYYDVKQGDCISSIGDEHGFFWETIWEQPENENLRNERRNPNALLPGDRLFIPDIRLKDEYGETKLHHHFRLLGVPVRLRFCLQTWDGRPRPDIPYVLEVDGKKTQGTTDETGMLEMVIQPHAKKAKITATPPGCPDEKYEFDLGYMNPAPHITGVQGRLKNLGFYKDPINGNLDDATRDAIKSFQKRSGLPETGEVTPDLVDALDSAHGG